MTDVPQDGPTCPLTDRELRAVIAAHVSRVTRHVANGNTTAQEVGIAVVAAERARLRGALEQVTQGSDAAWARHAVRSFDEACEYVDATTRRA